MPQSTPRKFSEKIAMMTRKQNEDQEAFRRVMNEVKPITRVPTVSPTGSNSGESPVSMGPPDPMLNRWVPNPQQQMVYASHLGSPVSWNRPGCSLPNLHSAIQQQPEGEVFPGYQYWQNQSAGTGSRGGNVNISPADPQTQEQTYARTHHRTRSPGAQYHPYSPNRKSNDRLAHYEPGMSQNFFLQPPDPSWENRTRSDPTIHINATATEHQMYYNGHHQWTPAQFHQMNGTYNQQQQMTVQQQQKQQQQQRSQQLSDQQQPQNSSTYVYATQNGSSTYHPGSVGSAGSPYERQQHELEIQQQRYANMRISSPPTTSQQAYLAAQQQQSPTHIQYQQQQQQLHQHYQSAMMQQQQQATSYGPFRQNLATPAVVSESQSAPTSPAQTGDPPLQSQWPPNRHYSASSDTMDIPNIVLTGADGILDDNLDCFQDLQDLNLDSDEFNSAQPQLDPSSESQLLSN